MLTEYQKHLLKLYKEIDEICGRFGIEYCAAGGTMIGAIRHRGFIPWDDDMDIYMTQKNWHKFMNVCHQDGVLPKGRVLACQEFNRNYHNVIGRYTDLNMTTIHKNQVLHDDEAGFVIDILCLDPIPDDKKSADRYNKDVLLYSDLINGSMVYSYRFRANKFRFLWYRFKMKIFGNEKILQKIENMITQYDEDECDFYAMRWGGVPLVFPKEMIGDCSVVYKYEDTFTRCPNKPFDYLVYHYGDEWMYVPPTEEQENHETVAVFNTDLDYPNLKSEIYNLIDKKKARAKLRTRQKIAMLHENSWNDLKDVNLSILKVADELYFARMFDTNRQKIEEAFAQNNYAELSEIFDEYISVQSHRKIIGRFDAVGAYRYYAPILIEVQSHYFELVLLTLFNTGKIAVAKRFIDVYEFNKGSKTPFIEELNNDILTFREAVSCFASGDFDKSIPLIDSLIEKYPNSIGVINLQICRYTRIESIDDNLNKVRKLAERGLRLYPGNKDFEKYLLDTEFADNKEKVLLKYVYAFHDILNGFMRLDIMDVVSENLNFYFDYCDKHLTDVIDIDDFDEDNKQVERYLEGIITIGKPVNNNRKFVSVDLIDKIIQILPDNARVFEKKFDLLRKIAEVETDPVIKAENQHRLIKYIRKIYKKYSPYFEDGEYKDIEKLVNTWFKSCYLEICNSEYITKITAKVYAVSEYKESVELLDRLRDDMHSIDVSSDDYLYCMELESLLLYQVGKSEESRKILFECIENSNIPYLNCVLGEKLRLEVNNIYRKLYSSYNKYYIHKEIETQGLNSDEAYAKSQKNKKRLIRFYKTQIDRDFPSVLRIINYLLKLNLLKEKEAKQIIENNKIIEDSRFTLRIATAICECLDSVSFSTIDEVCIEDVDDNIMERFFN
ncbi:MAG: LicD family protein [Ruminococcus sp.]|nr:LicD family protein [Ruminococcus sp.]